MNPPSKYHCCQATMAIVNGLLCFENWLIRFHVVILIAVLQQSATAQKTQTKQVFPEPKILPYSELCKWIPESIFDNSSSVAAAKHISANDSTKLKQLISRGLDVNSKGKHNCTLLLLALNQSDPDCFNQLLQAGADPNIKLSEDFEFKQIPPTAVRKEPALIQGSSVTSLVCESPDPSDYFDLVFQHGGNPNIRYERDNRGQCPLNLVLKAPYEKDHSVMNHQLKTLLDCGAEPNYRPKNAMTPLGSAMLMWNLESAVVLLEGGADLWQPVTEDMDHYVPLHLFSQSVVVESGINTGSASLVALSLRAPDPSTRKIAMRFREDGLLQQDFELAQRDIATQELWHTRGQRSFLILLPMIHKARYEAMLERDPNLRFHPYWLKPRSFTEEEFRRNPWNK